MCGTNVATLTEGRHAVWAAKVGLPLGLSSLWVRVLVELGGGSAFETTAAGAALLLVLEAIGAVKTGGAGKSSSSDEKPASMNCGTHGAGADGSSCLAIGPE